jgi:serine-type D-Ala-D-Ala carboxypeptidase/endopeptidase (penicillin-binding protein 4)
LQSPSKGRTTYPEGPQDLVHRRLSHPGVIEKRGVALVAALLALALAPALASGQSLGTRLDRALATPGVTRAQTGAFAFNLQTSRLVYGRNTMRAFEPASVQKLTVAVTALDRFGPGYRIPTDVLGDGTKTGATWNGRLVLKGYGDPTLTLAKMRTLAQAIRASGIRTVTGRVIADESYYDTRRMCPGWKPSWYKIESPPLSALVVARAKVNGRTVDNPARAAGDALHAALRAAGVRVLHPPRVGKAPPGAVRLAGVHSSPLSLVVRTMNKMSDNFRAEMLLKHLGKKERGAGTSRAGAIVIRNELNQRGVPLQGVQIVDGSGLSPYDKLTARGVALLLVSAWFDSRVKSAFVSSLPIAGIDGTLEDRMERAPARGRVRAKTGTTMTSSALAGYAGTRYVFAILQNRPGIPWINARRAQDRFAQILAGAAS